MTDVISQIIEEINRAIEEYPRKITLGKSKKDSVLQLIDDALNRIKKVREKAERLEWGEYYYCVDCDKVMHYSDPEYEECIEKGHLVLGDILELEGYDELLLAEQILEWLKKKIAKLKQND